MNRVLNRNVAAAQKCDTSKLDTLLKRFLHDKLVSSGKLSFSATVTR